MIARLRRLLALFHRPHGGTLRSSSTAVRELMRDLTGPHNESKGDAA